MSTRAAACLGLLALVATAGCAFRDGKKAAATPPAPAPKPVAAAASHASPEPPYSTVQTVVELPAPQPVNAAAMAAVPEPVPVREADPPDTPRPRGRPVTAGAAAPAPPPPEPAAAPTQPSRRIRVTETAADRRRILQNVETRRKEVEDNLNRAQRRQLSSDERLATERARAFLVQATAAVKKNDLQEADELSRRALLLSQDLTRE